MIVGKTVSTNLREDILNNYTEVQMLTSVFPQIKTLPYLMCSPLRVDNKPSFSIYVSDGGKVYYKDHANKERGSLLTLLSKYWNCSLNEVYEKLSTVLTRSDETIYKPLKVVTRKESNELTEVHVVVREWRDYDLEYWKSYGVEKKWLKYAEVYPISYKIVIKKEHPDDSGKKYVFPADTYAYVFVERKEGKLQLKVYQPYNTKGYKWCSKMDSSVIGLWTKIPKTGDRVVICSSLKDALCISCQLHIPALCLQGEGYNISDTAIKELKKRYKKVFISFDTDKAGIEDSTKLAEYTGFINVIPDLGNCKDYSDYYKSLQDKTKFKELKNLFL